MKDLSSRLDLERQRWRDHRPSPSLCSLDPSCCSSESHHFSLSSIPLGSPLLSAALAEIGFLSLAIALMVIFTRKQVGIGNADVVWLALSGVALLYGGVRYVMLWMEKRGIGVIEEIGKAGRGGEKGLWSWRIGRDAGDGGKRQEADISEFDRFWHEGTIRPAESHVRGDDAVADPEQQLRRSHHHSIKEKACVHGIDFPPRAHLATHAEVPPSRANIVNIKPVSEAMAQGNSPLAGNAEGDSPFVRRHTGSLFLEEFDDLDLKGGKHIEDLKKLVAG